MKDTMNAKRVTCTKNEGFSVSLTIGNAYDVLPDEKGAKLGLLRVIDETGEDYLYPSTYFVAFEGIEVEENRGSGVNV